MSLTGTCLKCCWTGLIPGTNQNCPGHGAMGGTGWIYLYVWHVRLLWKRVHLALGSLRGVEINNIQVVCHEQLPQHHDVHEKPFSTIKFFKICWRAGLKMFYFYSVPWTLTLKTSTSVLLAILLCATRLSPLISGLTWRILKMAHFGVGWSST